MITLKVLNPCVFLNEIREDLCVVYASDENNIRYNVRQKTDGEEPSQSCASALCSYPLESEWEATDELTINPQPVQ